MLSRLVVFVAFLSLCIATDYVQEFLKMPNATLLESYSTAMSSEPHLTGTPENLAVAHYIIDKLAEFNISAEIETYETVTTFPIERSVEMVAPFSFKASMQEPYIPSDPYSNNTKSVPTYLGFGGNGEASGGLVYVNFGRYEDFELLKDMGIDLKDKILIARYGAIFRGIKPMLAEKNGAAGMLIYSDPQQNGFTVAPMYPDGPSRPELGVERGSTLWIQICPGDPRRVDMCLSDANGTYVGKLMPSIPVLPLSWGDAKPLLENIGGLEVPNDEWRGGLNMTYRIGDGTVVVNMSVNLNYTVVTGNNVVAKIPGDVEPDKIVHAGAHYDAWVFGTSDDVSGVAAIIEAARGFSKLMADGWKPRRSIWLHAWDGEEQGLIGSTMWAEANADLLTKNSVCYLNADSGVSGGNFGVSATPSLAGLIREVAGIVPYPGDRSKTLLEQWGGKVEVLGSGSDYTVFLDHLGIPGMNTGFGGINGQYHSIYDDPIWMSKFADPGYIYHKGLTQVFGAIIMRFADDDMLPFEFDEYADELKNYVTELERIIGENNATGLVDLEPIKNSTAQFSLSATSFKEIIPNRTLSQINDAMQYLERDFLVPEGLPGRTWYKHILQAPGFYIGYGAENFPGVTDAVRAGDYDLANAQAEVIGATIHKAAKTLEVAELEPEEPSNDLLWLWILIAVVGSILVIAIIAFIVYRMCSHKTYEQVQ